MKNRGDRSCIVHQLPEYEAYGYRASYEYPLPAQLDRATHTALNPWLRKFVSLSSADAHTLLQARWAKTQHDSIRLLRDGLLTGEVASLVVNGLKAWLLIKHANASFHLVAPPLVFDAIRLQQAKHGLQENLLLTELLTQFGGLREDLWPSGGCFIDDQDWSFINQPFMKEIAGYEEWQNSLVIFSSRGGDLLLLHPEGRVGWWVSDEVRMREAYGNLAECIADFIRYRHAAWPFNPYPLHSGFEVVG